MTKEKDLQFIIIPNEVSYCKKIPASAKLLLGEIILLCAKNNKDCCWASNNYFAELFEVSTTSISLWIKSLQKYKFIKCKINHTNNSRKIFLKTSISKLKHNIYKYIYREPVSETGSLSKNNTFVDKDLKVETKEWVNKKGQKVGIDTIDYEEKED